jgi:undecaprenyl pyrophosphate phosphatase UppP
VEELLIWILQAFVELFSELFGQIVLEFFIDLGLRALKDAAHSQTKQHPIPLFIGYLLLGAVIGGISTAFLPDHFIKKPLMRWVNLIVTPAIAGMLMGWVGGWNDKRGRRVINLERFPFGWAFAIGLAVVRHILCS